MGRRSFIYAEIVADWLMSREPLAFKTKAVRDCCVERLRDNVDERQKWNTNIGVIDTLPRNGNVPGEVTFDSFAHLAKPCGAVTRPSLKRLKSFQ